MATAKTSSAATSATIERQQSKMSLRGHVEGKISMKELLSINPDLAPIFAKVDVNKDGNLCSDEIVLAMELLQRSTEEHAREKVKTMVLKGSVCLFFLFLAILLSAMVPVMMGAIELSKDMRPNRPVAGYEGLTSTALEAAPGVAIATDAVKSYANLLELPAMSIEHLREMRDVVVEVTVEGRSRIEILKVGRMSLHNTSYLQIYSQHAGSVLQIDSAASSASLLDCSAKALGGSHCASLPVVIPKGRVLSTATSPPVPRSLHAITGGAMAPGGGERGRDLQFGGGGFGGALLTTGSFTMMAASGGF